VSGGRRTGTVLVTGGSGFLGTAVVRGLVADGVRVVSGDVRAPVDRVRGAHHVHLDVTDAAAVDRAVAGHRPGTVVHLASVVTPGPDSTRARQHAVDVGGTEHVLAACLAYGVRRVVVSSSGAAYGYHPDNGAAHGGWLTEDDPLRGNEEFAYSHHKRLVEERLAALRETHPGLEQVVLRIGTILGERVDNQITALFERRRLLRVAGSDSAFVFAWDADVAAVVRQAVTGEVTGVFNVAGDGAMTVADIARAQGRGTLTVPEPVLRGALRAGRRLRLSPYGPEQTMFLRHRPLLDNTRLKREFGYTPRYTSREAFAAWQRARRR
jgi:UDP-glucose 4-epimerase